MISFSNRTIIRFLSSPVKISQETPKTLSLISKMSSWTCSKCTFINPPTQKSRCEICLSSQPQPQSQSLLSSSTTTSSSPSNPKWSCASCTFLNPYCRTICEVCGARVSASLTLEVDDDDLDEAHLTSSLGTVFLPLQGCSNVKKDSNGSGNHSAVTCLPLQENADLGNSESQCVENGGGKRDSTENKRFLAAFQPCSNKRKDREEGGSSVFGAVKASGEIHLSSETKLWKILSYNVWFREDLEMHNRMRALGNLIQLHSPDVICLQEMTPSFYEIFQRSNWWKGYQCSISDKTGFPGGYFCMQLSKLPVKSYSSLPFHNSIMGRELCIAEVEVQPKTKMVVATSHLESPCPGPPTWDQMFSKERVEQANEALKFLDKNQNVIFCGDMNWDDKSDGPFPLCDGWTDAWTELRPGEVGWTYDTKSNKMLSGNRALQKRLDRFICKLKDFKICRIEMIGREEIPGLSYIKEKKVKGQVKELELPVLPSDHYGLLLSICPSDLT